MLDKKSKRAFLLLSATTAYLVFGSLTFSAFEYDEDMQLREEIRETREAMQEKYNFTQQDFEELEQVVVASIPFKAGYQWQFAGAFYFCAVVLTTIGYGHSTPATTAGKLFCMVFALVGIPLGLVTFQSTGERVNTFVRYCLVKLRDALARRGIFILKEVKARHLLVVSSSVGGVMILVGTIVFHTNEHWSMFDALYYCVITLLCIGFGDLVPLQTDNRLQQDTAYVLFALFFILFGLAIFSACVNLLVLEFMARNADIVTARGRLRRFASSLRRTTSFRRRS
ncbi:CRE-TWK-20 protein [Aphelenchoides avenae]|nr:CRE-TWK-20 protein [Aphelenchus avenae]